MPTAARGADTHQPGARIPGGPARQIHSSPGRGYPAARRDRYTAARGVDTQRSVPQAYFDYKGIDMAGKMLRAVAFDLDNTLLRDDKSVSDYTVRVLKELHRRGTAIIPSTGRALYRVTPYCEMLGCADYVISLNGAQVFRVRNSVSEGRKLSNEVILGTAELIHKETMSPADAAGMIRYMAPYISYARAFVDDETLQQTFIPGDMPFIQKLYFYHTFDFEEFGDLAGYLEKTDRTIWKVAGFFSDHKNFELL